MKFLKKCTPFMLAVMFAVQPAQVFANTSSGQSGTTARTVANNTATNLTVREAARRASDNSSAIRNTQDNIVASREQEQRMRNDMVQASDNLSAFLNASVALMQSQMQRALADDSINVQRDTIHFLVTNHFANIVRAEKALELYDANLAMAERDIIVMEVMVDLGLESQASLNLARANFERTVNERVNLMNSIDEGHRELNRLMGVPLDRRHNLIFDIEFQELGEVNLSRYISNHSRNNMNVRQANANLDVAQLQLDNHMTPIDMQTGIILPGGVSRDERIVGVNVAARAVQDARSDTESNVVSVHTQIRNIEALINSAESQLESMQVELNILNTRLALGQITPIEVDRYRLGMMELEEQIRQLKVSHSLTVMQLRNPNILF